MLKIAPVAHIPRRWRWVLTWACVPALALLLVFLFVDGSGDEAVAQRPEDPGVAVAAPPAPQPVVATRAAAAAPSGASGVVELEVCGGTWLQARPDGSLDRGALLQDDGVRAARDGILAELRSGPSVRGRAAAMWLAAFGNDGRPRETAPAPAAECAGDACVPTPPPATGSAVTREVAAARDALARTALTTTDAVVYALAFHTCNAVGTPAEGACAMLNAQQWARLDPGNAGPWWFMLAGATARRDLAGQDEALHRIATAARSDRGTFVIPGLIVRAAGPSDTSMLAAWAMSADAIGLASSWAAPHAPLVEACRPEALRDPNRRQTCAAIADVLVQRSDTLAERAVGVAVGGHLGWQEERIDRLHGETAAYLDSLSPDGDAAQGLSCALIRRDLATLLRHATGGEAGAMRRWVERSPAAVEAFAGRERARRQLARDAPRGAGG